MSDTTAKNTVYRSTLELSIRRKNIQGLPGDDPTLHNMKIGSSLKGNGPLRGLDYDEERIYLPEIIGIDPSDVEWRKEVASYWNNISVGVPADGTTIGKLQGKVLKFTIEFKDKATKTQFDSTTLQEDKAEISKQGVIIDGVNDFILWRYCLVYRKVANRFQDIGKSAKILFYLYSRETETKIEHSAFKLRMKANDFFTDIIIKDQNTVVDAVLLMFEQDLSAYDGIADKHLALEALIKNRPAMFISFMEDKNLGVKATIKKAVEHGIIHRPANTDSYHYGENNEVTLGTTLADAVIYWKSEEERNTKIVMAIKARLKQI